MAHDGAFKFHLDPVSSHEIHRDPGGHYHHWSILVGSLLEGEMRVGQRLQFQTAQGFAFAARILAFHAFRLQLGDRVCGEEAPEAFGVVAWGPAVRKKWLCDTIATACDDDKYTEIAGDWLARDPSVFFHSQGRSTDPKFRCHDCWGGLHRSPELKDALKNLSIQSPDPTAKEARRALASIIRHETSD